VLDNREVLKRTFPNVFEASHVLPIDDYPGRLLENLRSAAPVHNSDPRVVVLTPGIYNSAYFEHSFLAQQMGVELVEGRDLVVDNGFVNARTTQEMQRSDVIYRRIDDDFIDPKPFAEGTLLMPPHSEASLLAAANTDSRCPLMSHASPNFSSQTFTLRTLS
jgi:uncharacterized circularly permuted ATP-grasp superfamily protein